MGTLVPTAFQALDAFRAVGTIASVVGRGIEVFDNSDEEQRDLSVEQLRRQQQLNQQQAIENANLQRQEIASQTEKAETERRAALKRAVARQRAQFGSSGMVAGDGSTEAVLLGLFEESDDERASRERLDNLKLQSIDQGLSQTSRSNTLQRTQLIEKNNLRNTISPFEQTAKFLSVFK